MAIVRLTTTELHWFYLFWLRWFMNAWKYEKNFIM